MKDQSQDFVMDIKWKARVLFFYVVIALISVPYLMFFILITLMGAKYKIRYNFVAIPYSWLFLKLLKLICGIDYEVKWEVEMPKGPCIIMGNHQSFWDNIIPNQVFPIQSWIIKRQLYNIPIFGFGLRLMDPIAVDRNDNISVKQILSAGTAKIASGLCVVMYPEATRLRPGVKTRMKPSGVKLAQLNKVPIVLMAHNAGIYWPKGFWIIKPGTIKMTVGKVLNVKPEDDVRKALDEIENWINTEKDKLSGH